jgi:hypothetical protein
MSSYWIVAWEEGLRQHKTEARNEEAAEAHAHELIKGRGLTRVVVYEIMGDR